MGFGDLDLGRGNFLFGLFYKFDFDIERLIYE